MEKIAWFERKFEFGSAPGMLPFYLERLKGTVPRLMRKTLGISEDVLSNAVDGKWSIKQNIGHLTELDAVSAVRVREIVDGVPIMSPAVFEPRSDYNAQSIGSVIKSFEMSRQESVERYQNLSLWELRRTSVHPRLKVQMTPVDLALFEAEHDDHHLLRISEILALLSK